MTYSAAHLLMSALFLFCCKAGSRRNMKFKMNTAVAAKNHVVFLELFGVKGVEKIPHGDTVNYLLERISPEETAAIRTRMVKELIRRKCFLNGRLFGYYLIALDGSRIFSFKERHCEQCLTQKTSDGGVRYFHPVLEAKLVGADGMALSVETEFIENPGKFYDKQDCELKAFYRLTDKLKAQFPQLRICLLLDGLYPGKRVFSICRAYGWKYLITFKEGSMPEVYREYEDLKFLESQARFPENRVEERIRDGLKRTYTWIEAIEYAENLYLNVVECEETKQEKATRFVWLTNFSISRWNCRKLSEGARLRWKIENEGFNVQKNGGYELEHAYSHDRVAMKNFYLVLQMAHTIMQLMERGNLLEGPVMKIYGSLKNFAEKLLIALTTELLKIKEMTAFLNQRIQIRLNTS
jgi:hypothetical protein